MNDMWTLVGFGVIMLLTALMFLVMLWRTMSRRRQWTRVDGTVTSVRTKRQNTGETQTTFNYRYVDATGEQQRGTDTPLLRAPRRKATVAVMYDPAEPARSEIASTPWLRTLAVLSVLLICVGGWVLAGAIS